LSGTEPVRVTLEGEKLVFSQKASAAGAVTS
jgi:membrane-bound inhibitor of C-type lysozyme